MSVSVQTVFRSNGSLKAGGNDVAVYVDSADASFYYQETAAAELARFDSSAMLGNLANAIKNAVFLLPPPHKLVQPRPAKIEST